MDEELRSKLEAAYKQDPKAVLKEEELHVRLASVYGGGLHVRLASVYGGGLHVRLASV